MDANPEPIIVEEVFVTGIAALWKALTDPKLMRQWFFEQIEDFKPEVGFRTQFTIHVDDRSFTHLWKVTAVEAPHRITINWKFEEHPGDSQVTFELAEQNDKVKFKLTAEVLDPFPANIPEFKRESGVDGWNYFIRKRLVGFVEAHD